MEEWVIKVPKTVRVLWLKNKVKPNSRILIALHGYGQLNTYFSKHFEALLEYTDILVPEGLSRFYLSGTDGRVGASWMTRENRLDDIEDNIEYLNQIRGELASYYEKIDVLGFSQGAATAARWMSQTDAVQHFIIVAGIFPPDVAPDKVTNRNGRNYFLVGDEDPYFIEQKQGEILALYRSMNFEVFNFAGKHEIPRNLLAEMYRDGRLA